MTYNVFGVTLNLVQAINLIFTCSRYWFSRFLGHTHFILFSNRMFLWPVTTKKPINL